MFMGYWKGWKDTVIVNRLLKIFLYEVDNRIFVKEINNNLNNKKNMIELRFKRDDMTIVISSPDAEGDTCFRIFDHEDRSYGPNAVTYLSTPQVQELINHLTACLESKNITK